MRQDLVAAALEDIRAELFADVVHTPAGGVAQTIPAAISGVQIVSEEAEFFGQKARVGTHWTTAPKALFPALAPGDRLDELDAAGATVGSYEVLDVKPWGDGRLEIAISLKALR